MEEQPLQQQALVRVELDESRASPARLQRTVHRTRFGYQVGSRLRAPRVGAGECVAVHGLERGDPLDEGFTPGDALVARVAGSPSACVVVRPRVARPGRRGDCLELGELFLMPRVFVAAMASLTATPRPSAAWAAAAPVPSSDRGASTKAARKLPALTEQRPGPAQLSTREARRVRRQLGVVAFAQQHRR